MHSARNKAKCIAAIVKARNLKQGDNTNFILL